MNHPVSLFNFVMMGLEGQERPAKKPRLAGRKVRFHGELFSGEICA